MKVGILTNAFCERDLISGCIDQFEGLYPHLVLVSAEPWHGYWKPDDTHVVALKHGAQVVVGNWESASQQLNYGLSYYEGYDWVVICDADERYEKSSIEQLMTFLEDLVPYKEYGAVRTNSWDVYWKTPDYKLTPHQTDYPLIAIRPTERFGHIRSYSGNVAWTSAHMHHFSYVRSNTDMLKKVRSFEASTEFNPPQWYEDVWAVWDEDMENLHPVNPEQFKRAVYSPCPESVRRYLPC